MSLNFLMVECDKRFGNNTTNSTLQKYVAMLWIEKRCCQWCWKCCVKYERYDL